MITCPVEFVNGTQKIDPNAAIQLFDTGAYYPAINRVIFNTGSKPADDGTERPVLATIVEFADGTKSTVINSIHDTVALDAEGHPTRESKEAGFVYAVMKRILCGQLVENYDGNLLCDMKGFGRILADYVDNAYDFQKAKKENAAKKAAAVKAHAELKANAKPKHASLAEVVDKLAAIVDGLVAKANG